MGAPKKYNMQAKSMASSVDWRDSGATASMGAAHWEKYGSTVQMSEQQVVDCDNRDGGCNGGPNFFCDNHGLVGDEEELKKMLNDRPVAVAVDATPFQFYSSGILDCRSFHSLNHAVFAVGYNDGSDFIVRNSWGASWGENGYVRVGMGGNPCGIADYPAYAITK